MGKKDKKRRINKDKSIKAGSTKVKDVKAKS